MPKISASLTLLIRDERVRPQGILLLAVSRQRALTLADAIRHEKISCILGVHVAFKAKDSILCQQGASANEFNTDVKVRACFYVASTRAVEHLEISAYERTGLVAELGRLLEDRRT